MIVFQSQISYIRKSYPELVTLIDIMYDTTVNG